MTTAYVFIHAEAGRASDVASDARQIDGVVWAETVTGQYDVIVRAETDSLATLSCEVVDALHGIDGVMRTVTCPVIGHHDPLRERVELAHV